MQLGLRFWNDLSNFNLWQTLYLFGFQKLSLETPELHAFQRLTFSEHVLRVSIFLTVNSASEVFHYSYHVEMIVEAGALLSYFSFEKVSSCLQLKDLHCQERKRTSACGHLWTTTATLLSWVVLHQVLRFIHGLIKSRLCVQNCSQQNLVRSQLMYNPFSSCTRLVHKPLRFPFVMLSLILIPIKLFKMSSTFYENVTLFLQMLLFCVIIKYTLRTLPFQYIQNVLDSLLQFNRMHVEDNKIRITAMQIKIYLFHILPINLKCLLLL